MAIATNGLDQDMMQRNLACRDSRQSQKNMIVSGVTQFFVIALFLLLGTVLVMFITDKGIAVPEKTDELFGMVARHPDVPVVVLVLFVLGLISAAYSAAGSALTSLTTSYTVDILGAHKKKRRKGSDSHPQGRASGYVSRYGLGYHCVLLSQQSGMPYRRCIPLHRTPTARYSACLYMACSAAVRSTTALCLWCA